MVFFLSRVLFPSVALCFSNSCNDRMCSEILNLLESIKITSKLIFAIIANRLDLGIILDISRNSKDNTGFASYHPHFSLYSHSTSVKAKKLMWVPHYELNCKLVWDSHVSPNVLFSDLGFHPGISLHLVIVPLSLLWPRTISVFPCFS